MGSRIVIRRNILFKASPLCQKCGIELVRPEDLPNYWPSKYIPIYEQPDNMATLQHKYCKGDRKIHPHCQPDEQRWFLWCKKCNMEDAQECMKRQKNARHNSINNL